MALTKGRLLSIGSCSFLLLTCFVLSFSLPQAAPSSFNALVFTKTSDFRHESIPAGLEALRTLADEQGFSLFETEDANVFNDSALSEYQVVIFLNTTGDILNDEQQAAFERFIRSGNGFAGIHSAADTEYDWPFYGEMVGAYFESHPAVQQGTIKILDQVHPSTSHLPDRWIRTDEWYNYQSNPRGNVHVLATLESTSFQGGSMGHDHPISWCQNYEGGRSWYTGLGHTSETFEEPLYIEHILQGIRYAAGVEAGDCTATVDAFFEKTVLDTNTDNPMYLDIAGDGTVYYVERAGAVKAYDPQSESTSTIGQLEVTTEFEDGLLGIVLDPAFENNQQLYLFYSPNVLPAKQHVSRFTLSNGMLDLSSEAVLLEIPVQRNQCCHSGGALTFDSKGNLFIATGDNTNPFESDGYAPLDERPNRSAWDAQRTSGNTNDLRGKILRITPQEDGSYTIPNGNLFPPDGSEGLPEIYIMGVRNPFRIGYDTKRDWLYWGDVGPDASSDSPQRGTLGYDEFNQARQAGNFGWPFCSGDNRHYVDYDFQTGASGSIFDCDAPVNASVNNTGSTLLPPAQPAWIWYPYAPSNEFPQLPTSTGRTAMGGPIFHYDDFPDSISKLPAYYDDTVFIYEWARNWIMEVKIDEEGGILDILPFAPEINLERPIAMELGPEGALYLLEWGSGFGGNNNNSQLIRINFVSGNRSPIASLQASSTSGPVPLTVNFSAEGSFDPDPGDVVTYAWDFESDGTVDATTPDPSFTYDQPGAYTATLRVSDQSENSASASVVITAGNTPPVVSIAAPLDGGFYNWGDLIPFEFTVEDAEDGEITDCSTTVFQPFVGHDDHSHPLDQFNACDGTFQIIDAHGADGDNLFYIVEATYTDNGVGGAPGLTTTKRHILHPKRIQAEHFTSNNGTMIEQTGDVLGGGRNVGFIEDGDYFSFASINLSGINFITYRVASAGTGGTIEVRVDSPDGPVISTTSVDPTGGWQLYQDVTAHIEDPGGTRELFFVFNNFPGASGLFNINWMDFIGSGIALSSDEENGLYARYFNNSDFTDASAERIDPKINFNWNLTSPTPETSVRTFSVRWTGFIEPEDSGSYRFSTQSNSNMKVWLNDELIIDHQNTAGLTQSDPVPLEMGRSYPVRVDFSHGSGAAKANLYWSNSSLRMARSIIPLDVLTPDSTTVFAVPIEDNVDLANPIQYELYPNPVRNQTTLSFSVDTPGTVTLDIFDTLGRRQRTVFNKPLAAGNHSAPIDTNGLSAGTYFFVLESNGKKITDSFVVIR